MADTGERRVGSALRDAGWNDVSGSLTSVVEIALGRFTIGGKLENPISSDYGLRLNVVQSWVLL